MSKVKIQGNASGTGVVTLTAPNTNTDRTITLPDSTGSILDSTSTLDATKLSGALPAIDGSALTGVGGGKLKKVVTLQSRTISTYTALTTGDGTEITPVTLTMTPTTAGNTVALTWLIHGEGTSDLVFLVTRNGTKLTDTTDASNNKWAGIVSFPYDPDAGSTPNSVSITIMDNNCLDVSSVYRLLVRSSAATSDTFYLNRPKDDTGSESRETGLSSCVAMEVEV